MPSYKGKKKSGTHSSLTDAASIVVSVLQKIPCVKSISPAEIKAVRSGGRFLTLIATNMGVEILVSGDGVQKLNVHTNNPVEVHKSLTEAKKLKHYTINPLRERNPG